MQSNIDRMRTHLEPLNVYLRPHVKTNKSIDVSRKILGRANAPIAVSTLREADYFLEHGITDMMYTVGIVPNKLDHVVNLNSRGAGISVILDNLETAKAVTAKAASSNIVLDVYIEVDCDGHRSGVQPESENLITIAKALQHNLVHLQGVMTHAGNSYNCESIEAIRVLASRERDIAVRCAETLRNAGFACPEVSIGSTPTALFSENLNGVTEVRAGVFVFFDLFMAGLGVCEIQDIAVSVLTTVIGHQHEKGWIIVDAGWMALSRDRGTARQAVDQGYGIVCNVGGEPITDLIMIEANQEHGILANRHGDNKKLPLLPVGTTLRILPNHVCATAAQFDSYQVISEQKLSQVWQRLQS